MMKAMWAPQPDDICIPVGKSDGVFVKVVASQDDSVEFDRFDGNNATRMRNRLSTFLQRFELLDRPVVSGAVSDSPHD